MGVSGAAYGELMVAVVFRRRLAGGWHRREVGVPGAVASGEAARARAARRDGLRHVRAMALRASCGRALATAAALALGGVIGSLILGASGGGAVALATGAATVVVVRWWKGLPPGTSPPDAVARAWQAIADGERRSAASLRRLVRQGWVVIHDPVLGDGRSLGQVVIGPPGMAVMQSCVCRERFRVDAGGVWMGTTPVDLGGCVAAAQVVCDLVAHELGRPGVRAVPVLAVHGAPLPAEGHHVAGVDVVPAANLVRYLQGLQLARLDAETIEAASRAVVARFDVAGAPDELNGAGPGPGPCR